MSSVFEGMSTNSLLDLLAQETERFTHLIAARDFTEEYEQLKEVICQLQSMIESRQGAHSIHLQLPDSINN